MTIKTDSISMDSALEVAEGALREISETALDLDCKCTTRLKQDVSTDQIGAYIPLLCDAWTMEIGLASGRDGCAVLTSALMMIDGLDDSLEQEDVVDAMGEVANLLAGGMKQRLHERFGDIRLGTPLILQGRIEALERQQLAVSEFKIGPANVDILVLLTPSATGELV